MALGGPGYCSYGDLHSFMGARLDFINHTSDIIKLFIVLVLIP
jgi:hypothetical protein